MPARRPNLAAANCRSLTAITTFRLGRKRLGEDAKVNPRQLLQSEGTTLAEVYKEDGVAHQLAAFLVAMERGKGGAADSWRMELNVVRTPTEGGALPRTRRHGVAHPFQVLKRLGKVGLEVDLFISAAFEVEQLRAVPLPAKGDFANSGFFSHLIGYTFAKLSQELGQILYEASVRWVGGQKQQVVVGFGYRRILDEHVLEAALERAAQIAQIVAAPRTESAASASGAGAQSAPQPSPPASSAAVSAPEKSEGNA